MGVLPPTNLAMIEWFEQRVASWVGDPTAIGLTAEQTTSLLSLTSTARAGYQAAQQARNASKAATVTFHNGADELRDYGADLIKTIKAFAEASDNPEVYALAEVPPPAEPEPLGPPGMPYDIATSLDNAGYLTITWKADNGAASTGAYFMIERRLDNEQSFTLIGGAGAKTFTDAQIPLGTTQAIYIIKPRRGELIGQPSNQVVVQFGVNIPGPNSAESGESGLNLAA